jgi:hypothetical protein
MYLGQNQYQEGDLLWLDGCGLEDDGIPLTDWHNAVENGFGCYGSVLGAINNPGWEVEVDELDDLGNGYVRTPMLEFSPDDFEYLQTVGFPHKGMQAYGDNGYIYEWTSHPTDGGLGGRLKNFFKKVGRGIKKGVKTVGRGVKKLAQKGKKFLAKTKFGRALIKIGGKMWKVAMKIVYPIAKKVGPWLARLAPIAMAIPGIGPAISAAMVAAGGVAKIITKVGGVVKKVQTISKTGNIMDAFEIRTDNPSAMKSLFASEAKKFAKLPKGSIDALMNKLKKTPLTSSAGRKLLPIQDSSPASKASASKLSTLMKKSAVKAQIASAQAIAKRAMAKAVKAKKARLATTRANARKASANYAKQASSYAQYMRKKEADKKRLATTRAGAQSAGARYAEAMKQRALKAKLESTKNIARSAVATARAVPPPVAVNKDIINQTLALEVVKENAQKQADKKRKQIARAQRRAQRRKKQVSREVARQMKKFRSSQAQTYQPPAPPQYQQYRPAPQYQQYRPAPQYQAYQPPAPQYQAYQPPAPRPVAQPIPARSVSLSPLQQKLAELKAKGYM